MTHLVIALLAYVILAFLNFGALNAESKAPFKPGGYKHLKYSERYRYDVAFAVLFSVIPIIGWLATLIMTGFYNHGFSWKVGCDAEGRMRD